MASGARQRGLRLDPSPERFVQTFNRIHCPRRRSVLDEWLVVVACAALAQPARSRLCSAPTDLALAFMPAARHRGAPGVEYRHETHLAPGRLGSAAIVNIIFEEALNKRS
jgi:hypothetical protein